MIVLQVLGSVCLILGTLICMAGAYGLLRFPSFFARVHAASIPDTLGAGLCLLGMIFFAFTLTPEQGYDMKLILLIVVKLVFIGVFIFVTSPIAGHALTKAALRNGLAGDITPLDGGVKDDAPAQGTAQEEVSNDD